MTEALAAKTCTPCKGGSDPMTRAEVDAHLAMIPDWTVLDGPMRLERTWKFKDFGGAAELVKQVSKLSDAEGHHPDICFGWGYATVTYYTHKIKGLHLNDFIMAAKVDEIAKALD